MLSSILCSNMALKTGERAVRGGGGKGKKEKGKEKGWKVGGWRGGEGREGRRGRRRKREGGEGKGGGGDGGMKCFQATHKAEVHVGSITASSLERQATLSYST